MVQSKTVILMDKRLIQTILFDKMGCQMASVGIIVITMDGLKEPEEALV